MAEALMAGGERQHGINQGGVCKSQPQVRLAVTEAGDVQHSDEVGGRLEGEALVHALDHVVEEAAVHRLGQGVTGVVGLFHLQRHPGEAKAKWER